MPRPLRFRLALPSAALAVVLCGCPGNPNEPGATGATPFGGAAQLRHESRPIMSHSEAGSAGAPPGSGSPVTGRSGSRDAPTTSVGTPVETARGVTPPG